MSNAKPGQTLEQLRAQGHDDGLAALEEVPCQAPIYLTVDEVIERYRGQVSEGTLRNWRALRIGPSYVKIGKVPLYPIEELHRWDHSSLVLCRRTRSSELAEP